jgi:hypothetical protein
MDQLLNEGIEKVENAPSSPVTYYVCKQKTCKRIENPTGIETRRGSWKKQYR